MEILCKIFGHNYQIYRWANNLSNLNTHGNYIRNEGGKVTEYRCGRCNLINNV